MMTDTVHKTAPQPHLSLKEIAGAYSELMGLRKQAIHQAKKIADLEVKYFHSQKALMKVRVKLGKAERGSPLNPNDEEILFDEQVELRFERPFRGGKRLVAFARGKKLVTVRRESEGQSLLPDALRKIRLQIRQRG